MKTECRGRAWRFQAGGGREGVARFDGGRVTFDGGGLLLKEVEDRFRFIERFAGCFTDYRDPDLLEDPLVDLLKQRIFGLCLGYEELLDHDTLRHDTLLAEMERIRGNANGQRGHQSAAAEMRGAADCRDNNLDDAAAELQQAVEFRPENVRAWYYLGEVHRVRGRLAAARAVYERCVEFDRYHHRALRRLTEGALSSAGSQAFAAVARQAVDDGRADRFRPFPANLSRLWVTCVRTVLWIAKVLQSARIFAGCRASLTGDRSQDWRLLSSAEPQELAP